MGSLCCTRVLKVVKQRGVGKNFASTYSKMSITSDESYEDMIVDQEQVKELDSNQPRHLQTVDHKYYYLDVEIDFGKNFKGKPCFTKDVIKATLVEAVKKLFGEFGAATTIDILQFNVSKRQMVIRCPSVFYVKLRSALTVATYFESYNCYYKVVKASPCLLALSTNSR